MNDAGYVWIVTRDLIDEGKSVGIWGPGCGNEKPNPDELPDYFRLLDDDGEVYFYGKTNALTGGSQNRCNSGFEPLDDLGAGYGCTSIEYRNASGKWEAL